MTYLLPQLGESLVQRGSPCVATKMKSEKIYGLLSYKARMPWLSERIFDVSETPNRRRRETSKISSAVKTVWVEQGVEAVENWKDEYVFHEGSSF